jgi:adenylate kinase family enzyme
MKKVIIIGCPGSGKSTFARKLKKASGLPLYHLDMIYWKADGTTVTRQILVEGIKEILQKPEWIIDGDYASTMEMRMKECDTVFFLDYPTKVCLDGINSRKGNIRSDMPFKDCDKDDGEFLSLIKNYNCNKRPEVMKLFEKYPEKNIIIFKSRQESESFFENTGE